MALISVGIDHEHADLDFLERATILEHEWSKVLRTLVAQRNIHEAVFISTCLRTEVVAVIDLFHGAIEDVVTTLAHYTGIEASEFEHRLSVHFDRGVASHLFAVAAGLKSVVPGEFEVLGQLRRALELAREEQTAGAELDDLFHRALAAGRRVRAETSIARGTTSFAQAACAMALEEFGDSFEGSRVVVVGAGQLATGVVRSLLDAAPALGTLTIVNRTRARAEDLARDVEDGRVVVASLADLGTHLEDADLVVVAAEVPSPILSRGDLGGRQRPLLLLDLAIPRAVSADVGELDGVRRVDVGDLRERIDRALDGRREAVSHAEALLGEDVERYVADQRARGASRIVSELREHFDDVVNAEFAKRERDFASLDEDARELVRSLVRSVVAKLAHRPTVALKEAAGTDQGVRLTEATRQLFDL